MNLTYPVGTRYSNSRIYDSATAEVVHGWQVFEQMRATGPNLYAATGRRSFVNHEGILCGLDLAESERAKARAAECNNALFALELALATLRQVPPSMLDVPAEHAEACNMIVKVLERANGIKP